MASQNNDTEQVRIWEILYARLQDILCQFGKEDWLGRADYWLLDDNWGPPQHMLHIHNLKMIAPAIVRLMQASLEEYPDWEIVVGISPEQYGGSWPPMGLTIRADEIVDDLEREYFPKEFQGFVYKDSRPGDARGRVDRAR